MDIISYALSKKGMQQSVSDYLDEHLTNPTNPPLDTSLTIANAAADSKATGDKLSELKEDFTAVDTEVTDIRVGADGTTYNSAGAAVRGQISDLSDTEYTDILHGRTYTDSWFVDPSTGVGRTLGSFYSYENVPIPEGATILFPYDYISASSYNIRAISFYNSSGTFISGVNGKNNQVKTGVGVPQNATKLSATLTYLDSTAKTLAPHYLSTKYPNTVTRSIKDGVLISANNVIGGNVQTDNRRMPCINFQFDDGNSKDSDIADIFKSKNLTCGFAIIANDNSAANYVRHMWLQGDGFEILSHSTDTTGMIDDTVESSVIDAKLKQSKEALESFGFNIKGFVTPNSTMSDKFRPLLRKYYQFAETVYYGNYTGASAPYQTPVDGIYNGWRISLQGTTLANQKAAVDACIENCGCLTFYGHSVNLDTTDYLTTENLEDLLDYINAKIASGDVLCGNPSDMILNYYHVRNDDVSNGWIPFTATEAGLDSRLTAISWNCAYNKKLKLASIIMRLQATEAISGNFSILSTMPFKAHEGQLINNNIGKDCFTYYGTKLVIFSVTWASGSSYRFTAMLRIG